MFFVPLFLLVKPPKMSATSSPTPIKIVDAVVAEIVADQPAGADAARRDRRWRCCAADDRRVGGGGGRRSVARVEEGAQVETQVVVEFGRLAHFGRRCRVCGLCEPTASKSLQLHYATSEYERRSKRLALARRKRRRQRRWRRQRR